MNDKYLWDKSGEPDEEIQHLESLLSEFRYQPRPLVLPEATPKRMIFSYLNTVSFRYAAIAAVALLALGLGLWLPLGPTDKQQQIVEQQIMPPAPSSTDKQAPGVDIKPQPEVQRPQIVKHSAPSPTRTGKAHLRTVNKQAKLEGEQAKEKVLYALQITSMQLAAITKKIQPETN